MNSETTYTVIGAAKELGLTSNWIRLLLSEGRMPGAIKRNGQWVIPSATVDIMRQVHKGISWLAPVAKAGAVL